MRRAQERVEQARPYAEQIRALVSRLANATGEDLGEGVALLRRRPVRNIGIVDITPDRGLCGALPSNINRKALSTALELAAALIWIGRRAWRSGVWLEAVPVALGMPWLARVIWLARAALVGRAFWRAGERVSRPLRSRRAYRRYHGHGYARYQRYPDGPWHQARVGDLSGTPR